MATATLTLSSQNRWLADGTTVIWNFNFVGGYINRESVLAYSMTPEGVRTYRTVEFLSDFTLRIFPAVPDGDTLVIYRDSRNNGLPYADFSDGSGISEANLDLVSKQAVFVSQEIEDFIGATSESAWAEAITSINDNVASAAESKRAAFNSATSAAASATIASAAAASSLTAAYSIAFDNTRGQLRKLSKAIHDVLNQYCSATFLGDSITWGVGAEGSATSTPRDQTLSDPRDYSSTGSYVNNVKRAIGAMMGNGVTTTYSNHPASPSGESVVTFVKRINVYPWGSMFKVVQSGVTTVAHIDDPAAICNAKEAYSVVPGVGNHVELSFPFTGQTFDVIFGCLANGAKYNVFVNDKLLPGSPFSTRDGDDGYTGGYSRVRTHTFDMVHDATVTLQVVHYDNVSGVSAVYLEALGINKTVRVRNQGLSGTTSKTYWTYSMPTSKTEGAAILRMADYPGFVATPSGTTSTIEREAGSSSTGWQNIYSFLPTSGWVFTVPVGADKELLTVFFSSLPNNGDFTIEVAGNILATVHTSALAPGGPATGYARSYTQTLPPGTTLVTIRSVYTNWTGVTPLPTCALYMEGLSNYSQADIHYPTTSAFGDGVALDKYDTVAFIQLGTNDRIASSTYVESTTTLRYYLEKILAVMPDTCSPVLMVAPPAVIDTAPTMHAGMKDEYHAIRSLAIDYGVDFIDNNTIFDGVDTATYLADGLHPNNLGHAVVSTNIVKAIVTA